MQHEAGCKEIAAASMKCYRLALPALSLESGTYQDSIPAWQ